MQHGGHADDRGGLADMVAHGVLGLVGVAEHAGQGPVVADGTGQHIGHAVALERVHDAVVHALLLDELVDASPVAHAVDGVQVMVVPVGAVLLGVDVLAERSVEVSPFQIVGGQGVAGEHSVHVAGVDDLREGLAGIAVEGEGRPHDPHDGAVLAVVAQKLVELVVIAGERRLARTAHAKSEVVVAAGHGRDAAVVAEVLEPVGVHEDALFAVLGAPAGDKIAFLDVPELAHEHAPVFHHGHTVHAAVFRKHPAAVELQVLRVDGHGVVVRRRHEVLRGRRKAHVGRLGQVGKGEVGGCIGGGREAHGRLLSGRASDGPHCSRAFVGE